jgi:hypothetical protein
MSAPIKSADSPHPPPHACLPLGSRLRPKSLPPILWLLGFLCIVILGSSSVRAADDNENSTPTAWWIHTGQTYPEVWNTIQTEQARIIDIKADSTLDHYTVTYVHNTGAYAKEWWFWVDIDATQLADHLKNTGARLTSLQAYDIGGGHHQ